MKKRTFAITLFLFSLLLVQLVLYSPEELEVRNPREFLKVDQWDENVEQNMENILLVESENNSKLWELKAESAKALRQTSTWEMNSVTANFESKSGVVYSVKSEATIFETESKNMVFSGNVSIISSNGYSFHTKSLYYYSEKQELVSGDAVRFEALNKKTPNKEKLRLSGDQLGIQLSSGIAQLIGNVSSESLVASSQKMKFSSDSVVFDEDGASADFQKNVVVQYEDMVITGDEARLLYMEKTQRLKKMEMLKGAKLNSKNKNAVAGKLLLELLEEKLILEDNPRLLQRGDELIGTRFVFSQKGKKIEIQGAKAHLESNSSGTVLDE